MVLVVIVGKCLTDIDQQCIVNLQEKVDPHSPPPAPPTSLLPSATSTPMPGSAAPCIMERLQHDSVSRLSDDAGDETTVVQPTGKFALLLSCLLFFFFFFWGGVLLFVGICGRGGEELIL